MEPESDTSHDQARAELELAQQRNAVLINKLAEAKAQSARLIRIVAVLLEDYG
jgi:hypothetical protein